MTPPSIEFVDAAVGGSALLAGAVRIAGITWSVHPGEFWVVGSRPGSGKSDLLATAAGLQKPLAGDLHLFGAGMQDVHADDWMARRLRIGMVFENGGRLFNRLTVRQNLELAVCYHRDCPVTETEGSVRRALEITGLTRLAGAKPAQVGRALHQRVALARALALNPEVLLIDNPLFTSDPKQSDWWLEFLPQLASGHPLLDNRPMDMVVTTTDFRPWLGAGREFAMIHQKQWHLLGDCAGVEKSDHPLARSMLSGKWDQLEPVDSI